MATKEEIAQWFKDQASDVYNSILDGDTDRDALDGVFQTFYALGVLDHGSYDEEQKADMRCTINKLFPQLADNNTNINLH